MKKIKELIKNNIRLIIGIVIGVFLSAPLAYAATIVYSANEIGYTNSGSQVSTIKGALDELYNRTKKWVNPNDMGTPTNYIYDGLNLPTTESPTTPPEGRSIYLALYSDNGYGVCIVRNGEQHCFRYRNWIAEKQHVLNVFSDISCWGGNIDVICLTDDVSCRVTSNGFITCMDFSKSDSCLLNIDNEIEDVELARCVME